MSMQQMQQMRSIDLLCQPGYLLTVLLPTDSGHGASCRHLPVPAALSFVRNVQRCEYRLSLTLLTNHVKHEDPQAQDSAS